MKPTIRVKLDPSDILSIARSQGSCTAILGGYTFIEDDTTAALALRIRDPLGVVVYRYSTIVKDCDVRNPWAYVSTDQHQAEVFRIVVQYKNKFNSELARAHKPSLFKRLWNKLFGGEA